MKRSLVLLVLCACGETAPTPVAVVDAGAGDATTGVDACADAAAPPSIDCTGGGPCPVVAITGDDPNPPGSDVFFFHGFADPSVRRDPASKRLWLAYSVPRPVVMTAGDGGSITANVPENHLAHSDDDGLSWTRETAPLFASAAQMDPAATGESGYRASEVASLTTDGANWYAIHLSYFQRPIAGYNPRGKSFHFRVSTAASPADFAAVAYDDELALATQFTDGVYQAQNLNATDPSLGACPFWNDPALFFQNGKLYLAAECQTTDPTKEVVDVFSTTPSGAPKTWKFVHVGRLSDNALATEVGALLSLPKTSEMMQVDLALASDGKLMTLLTPTERIGGSGASAEAHRGCVALEMASLDPPVLARDCNGKLIVRARVAATDEPNGTSACGYDPASKTGILLARRPDGKSANGIVNGFAIVASGLLP